MEGRIGGINWEIGIDIDTLLYIKWGFPGNSMVKNPPADAGDARDMDLILGLGRYPGEENGNPLKYSCLKNPIDRGAWQATGHGVAKELDTT